MIESRAISRIEATIVVLVMTMVFSGRLVPVAQGETPTTAAKDVEESPATRDFVERQLAPVGKDPALTWNAIQRQCGMLARISMDIGKERDAGGSKSDALAAVRIGAERRFPGDDEFRQIVSEMVDRIYGESPSMANSSPPGLEYDRELDYCRYQFPQTRPPKE
jgi:hypothetical protein